MKAAAPKDLISHPVAKTRANGLIEQQGFDRRAAVLLELAGQVRESAHRVGGLRSQVGPPGGSGPIVFEADASEPSRIPKDQAPFFLAQDQQIVWTGRMIARGDQKSPSHAQMQSEPVMVTELKSQLFSDAVGADQLETFEGLGGESGIDSPPGARRAIFRSVDCLV